MKKRVTYFLKIPVTLFFLFSHEPGPLLNGSCSNCSVGRHSQTHFPLIHDWRHEHNKTPFTGHPNLLELNPKKQPASKIGCLQIAWQPFITADVFKQVPI